ncbi:hypothetical protein J4456_00885, partial [Candidatus Pacearchaeota archaeon]|nr:hypothetical protein [Candidatus Pacearchaeota archaeon]
VRILGGIISYQIKLLIRCNDKIISLELIIRHAHYSQKYLKKNSLIIQMGEVDNIIQDVSPYYKKKKEASLSHTLVYDSPSEALEPLYFFILDLANKTAGSVEKVVDNFASSPGSGHFSELGLKKSQMQDQAFKLMGTINGILRSVLNLIYDLKEFKIRLSHYDAANSKNKPVAEAGVLALKQIWMDKVDVLRGQGSINALSSGNLQFVTLRDAFLMVEDPEKVDKMDLNERVKRLLKPRILEFLEWRKRSEGELRKRYEIEKTYLKSQVDGLKLQARWAKPYLKAAEKLAQNEKLAEDAAMVTAFNTVLLQLTLLTKKGVGVEEAATKTRKDGLTLPEEFKKMAKKFRTYFEVVVIDFKFTGIPSKVGQHYVFGGKAEIQFKGYGLNQDELDLVKAKLSESDLDYALKLVQGMTDDSLAQLKIDLEELLEEKKKEEEKNESKGLFDFMMPKKKEEKWEDKIKRLKEKGIKKDSYAEAFVRNLAIAGAMNTTFNIYDILKKAYGMASVPYGGDKGSVFGVAKAPQTDIDRAFGFK